jgi:hypothetical protein
MPLELTETTTDANPYARTEQLFTLLEAKRGLLSELRTLAILQADTIDRQEISELLNLLARKQGLMDRLMALQQHLQSFHEEDPDTRVWSSPQRRSECRETKRQCDQWIQEILIMEERAAVNMTAQRDAVAGQLLQSADSMRLSRAYGFDSEPTMESEGGFSLDG